MSGFKWVKYLILRKEQTKGTYFTDNEKSPGELSLTLIRKAPSCLFERSFSASALVILP